MIVRKCTAEDIEILSKSRVEPMCESDVNILDPEHAITIVDRGLVACGGVQPLWPGVGNAWMYVAPEARVKSLVEMVISYLSQADFHRIQCIVQKDFSKGRRFVRWLGFHREAVLRKYTSDKKDVVLYAMVR